MSAAGTDRSCSGGGAELAQEPPGERLGLRRVLDVVAAAGLGRARDHAGGERRRQQVGHRLAARRQAVDGDLVRVAAEGGNVLPGPPQRRDLVVQARGAGRALAGHVKEAERAEPVVDRDDHERVTARERDAVAGRLGGVAGLVPAAVQPEQHRPAARAGRRGHVQVQAVLARSAARPGPAARALPCGDRFPYSSASRTPLHGSGGSGGRNRRAPIGGRAYGMPRQPRTPSAISTPRTLAIPGLRDGHRRRTVRSPSARTISAGYFMSWGERQHVHDHVTGRCDRGTVRLRGSGRLPGRAGHRRGPPAAGRRPSPGGRRAARARRGGAAARRRPPARRRRPRRTESSSAGAS